jgi:flavin reductase (DIM6/NTAB) family NADH-FMN oxidoreductase RutF
MDLSKVHRLFYPDVPAVLCASYLGRVSAMPVVSFASLSGVPPLVGVSCDPKAFTYQLVKKSNLFSLCLLGREHVEAMGFLASHSGRKSVDKLTDAGLPHHRGKKLNVPIIDDSAASLECALQSAKTFGDRDLIVGKVEGVHTSADFQEYWRFRSYRPILYTGWQGKLATFYH